MSGTDRSDEEQLRSQLENYKLIVEVNKDLLDKNTSTRDELAAKLVAAQCFLDILDFTGDQANHSTALRKANQIISELDKIIKKILSEGIP